MEKKKKIFDKFIKFWLPPILWALVIFLFSSRPTGTVSEIYWPDFIFKKTIHIIEYGIFTFFMYRAFINYEVGRKKAAVYAIIFAFLYGASDEIHQSFTPGRDPTLRDVIFDTIGAILSIYIIWKLLPKAPERLKSLAKNLQVK